MVESLLQSVKIKQIEQRIISLFNRTFDRLRMSVHRITGTNMAVLYIQKLVSRANAGCRADRQHRNFSNGGHSTDETILFLFAEVDIKTGNTVTGNHPGFAFMCMVEDVKPLYNFWTDTVHHHECVLEVVN